MISNDRKLHIFGVAELLKKYAEEKGLGEDVAQEYYLLGLLHDIGYEFAEPKDYNNHHFIGGEVLKKQGYKHWQEVYWHGVIDRDYESEFLDILEWADMHIDSAGNYVSFEERLNEISERYNVPVENLFSKPVVDRLIKKGYK